MLAREAEHERGRTIAAVLDDLGKDSDFGDLATRGRVESAVLKLLRSGLPVAGLAGRRADSGSGQGARRSRQPHPRPCPRCG